MNKALGGDQIQLERTRVFTMKDEEFVLLVVEA